MFEETKELLLQDLIDIINIMNKDKFWCAPKKYETDIEKRFGSIIKKAILNKYKKTNINQLSSFQIEESIVQIYKIIIKS